MSKILNPTNQSTVGYLSAALRVSTHPDAQASGPRSHVLGTIKGFQAHGLTVLPYIVGDRMPRKSLTKSGEQMIAGSKWRMLVADLLRIGSGVFNARRAVYEIGDKVDFVYERTALLQFLGGHFQSRGIPWILESNGLFFFEARDERKTLMLYRIARYLETKAYRQCDLLVCVSEDLKASVIKHVGISEEKIIVLPNGVDLGFFDPATVQTKRFFNGLTIGYVGSVVPHQGLEILIEAIDELQTEGIIFYATIVGDGTSLESCKDRVAALGLEKQIRFTGQASRNDIPGLIAGCDIGFSGQVAEKFGTMYHSPLKIYEYMASAKPVLASSFPDARTVINERETGFLFEPGNRDDLKRALRLIYHYQDELSTMGMAARAEVAQKHSWESRIDYLLRRIGHMIAKKTNPLPDTLIQSNVNP